MKNYHKIEKGVLAVFWSLTRIFFSKENNAPLLHIWIRPWAILPLQWIENSIIPWRVVDSNFRTFLKKSNSFLSNKLKQHLSLSLPYYQDRTSSFIQNFPIFLLILERTHAFNGIKIDILGFDIVIVKLFFFCISLCSLSSHFSKV